ncbi:uncharacterized protein LOC119547692 [Drosophila subpulchrella]|uniref:uncharacterized protein LOC119547692 n=1 Tax=Drosophila subpulchrella TaxID=1486046 RepID=UPI0018A12CDF|nr:uncharacterized protein LOC119547692 [Drosophila subpulchrella]
MNIFHERFFILLILSNMILGNAASLKNMFCRPSQVKDFCLEENTWAFDQKTKSCKLVIATVEPCGFFNNEKDCTEFCLSKSKNVLDNPLKKMDQLNSTLKNVNL